MPFEVLLKSSQSTVKTLSRETTERNTDSENLQKPTETNRKPTETYRKPTETYKN
jgi:hypothetical protein